MQRLVQQGIEFAEALPEHLLDTSSTLKELYGVAEVVLGLAPLLRGGHRAPQGYHGQPGLGVHCAGRSAATGARQWGEFVSDGSPNPELWRLTVLILDAQIELEFSLTFVWVPRDLSVRAEYLLPSPTGDETATGLRSHDLTSPPLRARTAAAGTLPASVDKRGRTHAARMRRRPLLGLPAGGPARGCDSSLRDDRFFHPWTQGGYYHERPGRPTAVLGRARAAGTLPAHLRRVAVPRRCVGHVCGNAAVWADAAAVLTTAGVEVDGLS